MGRGNKEVYFTGLERTRSILEKLKKEREKAKKELEEAKDELMKQEQKVFSNINHSGRTSQPLIDLSKYKSKESDSSEKGSVSTENSSGFSNITEEERQTLLELKSLIKEKERALKDAEQEFKKAESLIEKFKKGIPKAGFINLPEGYKPHKPLEMEPRLPLSKDPNSIFLTKEDLLREFDKLGGKLIKGTPDINSEYEKLKKLLETAGKDLDEGSDIQKSLMAEIYDKIVYGRLNFEGDIHLDDIGEMINSLTELLKEDSNTILEERKRRAEIGKFGSNKNAG